jgi:hypothetical protein
MPRVSQMIIRTALVHLLLGSTLGACLLADKGLHLLPWLWTLKAGHVQILLVGAMVQIACGVAVWIMPRLDTHNRRGNLSLVWLGYGMLNSGVALAALRAPVAALVGVGATDWMAILSALLYIGAAASFIAHIWHRVLPFRMLPRP